MSLCAMLEDRGYRKADIANMTRWYALRVLQHARDGKGEVRPEYHEAGGGETPREQRRRQQLRLKLPDHLRG